MSHEAARQARPAPGAGQTPGPDATPAPDSAPCRPPDGASDHAPKDLAGKDLAPKDHAPKDHARKDQAGKDQAAKDHGDKNHAGEDRPGRDRSGKGHATKRLAFLPVAVVLADVFAVAIWIPGTATAVLLVVSCVAAAVIFFLARGLRRNRRAAARLAAERDALVARNWALVDAQSRLNDLVELRADVAYRKDPMGRLTYANRAYRETFGVGDEAIGTTTGPERLEAQAAEEAGEAPDVLLATVSGPRWFALDERAVCDIAGNLMETQCVARDVTARHVAEAEARRRQAAAEAAETAKSRLLAAVTHEVRTPVGGMIGMMDLLLDTDLAPEQESYTQSVRGSAAALLSLIDDLLDHAALESGRLAVVDRAYALRPIVQEVCELLGPRAEEKGLALSGFVARKLPDEIMGDPSRVRQILLNLVGNAIKFTERGGVIVEVRPTRGEGRFEIAVRDTGRGIAGQDQARIFGEFERVGDTQGIAGSGLGLAISRRLVEAMGGRLDLLSRPGRGSVFTISLPLRASQAEQRVAPPSLLDRQILVASPSPVTRRAIALSLRDEGARVATFARPRRVAAAVAAGAGRDGILVNLKMLPRLSADLAGRPVVVMLAPSEREALPRLKRRAGTSYLIRPVRRASLVARLTGAEPPAREEERLSPGATAQGPSRRVLMAEDDEVTALIVRSMLEKLGHTVERVSNGQEAVARSGRAPAFDLILVDMNMPGLGGAAAAAAIRNREARLGRARVPVVAMTAGMSDVQAATANAAGIDALLEKPLSSERLVVCIEGLTGDADAAGAQFSGNADCHKSYDKLCS